MAEEFYYIEEIPQNFGESSTMKAAKKRSRTLAEKSRRVETRKSQEIRLHEIEQQLHMAENRCNTLKGQVDYMKMLYSDMHKEKTKILKEGSKNTSKDGPKSSSKRPNTDSHAVRRKKDGNKKDEPWKELPSRDVDIKLKTVVKKSCTHPLLDLTSKDASEAVKSINNIISGITNSVNRLTRLQVNIGSSSANPITNATVGVQNIEFKPVRPEKPYQNESKGDHAQETTKKKKKGKKYKADVSTISFGDVKRKSKMLTNKANEKKPKTAVPMSAGDNSQVCGKFRKKLTRTKTGSSRSLLKRKSFHAQIENRVSNKMDKDKVIELYKNSAARIITASEESIPQRVNHERHHSQKRTDKPHPMYEKTETANFPEHAKKPLSKSEYIKIPISNAQEYGKKNPLTNPEFVQSNVAQLQSNFNKNITQGSNDYKNSLTPVNTHFKNHNFASSSFYRNYELPTIASKMKQAAKNYFENFSFRTIPFVAARSITPSHNLGVNIQQVLSIIKGKKPVSGISPTLAYNIELAANKLGSRPLSALVSTLGSRMNNNRFCPLTRRSPNYPQMQELAKEIPEETIEDLCVDNFEFKNASEINVDKELQNEEAKVWTITDNKPKCTCVPKEGVTFDEVYSKFIDTKTSRNSTIKKPLRHKPWNYNNRGKQTKPTPVYNSKSNQITRKERSLKEVLKNLYDEFAALNDRYDDIKKQINNGVNSGNNTNLVQELEKLEKILQNKEDEITMVMSLYKEVMTLKQQVRVLKKRASQSTILVSPFINRQRDYKEMNAAGHLTKLLRHIQQFQGSLKTQAPPTVNN